MVRSFAHRIPWIFIAVHYSPTHISLSLILKLFPFFLCIVFSHPGLVSPFLISRSRTRWVRHFDMFGREMFILIFRDGVYSLKFKWEKCYCGNMSTDLVKIFDIAFMLSTLFQIRCRFFFGFSFSCGGLFSTVCCLPHHHNDMNWQWCEIDVSEMEEMRKWKA